MLKINGAPLNKNNNYYLFVSQLRCVENGKFVLKWRKNKQITQGKLGILSNYSIHKQEIKEKRKDFTFIIFIVTLANLVSKPGATCAAVYIFFRECFNEWSTFKCIQKVKNLILQFLYQEQLQWIWVITTKWHTSSLSAKRLTAF